MVDVDVLVVGGGAQGLWLLNDLTKAHYRTILVERDRLGGGQTCHSHALIHRGHYYDDIDMMIVLNAAAQFWQAFVDSRGVAPLNRGKALAGFGPGTAVERHTYFWRTAGLRFQPCTPCPAILEGGHVSHVFETEEFSLDAERVVTALAADVGNAIYKLSEDEDALSFELDGRRVTGVRARLEGEEVELRPRYVVFAAGVGNIGLLAQLGADRSPAGVRLQAQRKNHMLVIRGRELPELTAVFPIRGGLQGVFICSRPDPERGGHTWLVADHNSVPFDLHSNGAARPDPRPSPEWVRRILVSLRATAPVALSADIADRLELAVYTGLTSERSFGVGQHMTDAFVDPLDFENVLTVWPTKLTLTPFASNVAMRFIRPRIPDPSGEWPTIDRPVTAPQPSVSPETWRMDAFETPTACKSETLPYREFLERWNAAGALV